MDPRQFTIGHYVCSGELLGRGSFASVYKGTNQKTKEVVAVKVIDVERLAKTNNPKLQQHLDQEISVMKAMKHENIVELLDVYKSAKGDELYMILEFCAGGDFSKYLAKQPDRRLTEEHARYFMRQLASGLRFLRSKQVIHRDLKPQNLLLAVNPSTRAIVLKIADFGFARFMEPQALAETLCGSPLYMAPELLKFQKYSVKADLWSVGAIMFEMLTGSVPFRCKNQMELMRMMETSQIVFPEALRPTVSQACLDLLFSLLRKDLNQRISWDEFFLHPWLGFSTVTQPIGIAAPATPTPSTPSTAAPLSSSPIPIGASPVSGGGYPPELPARKRSQSFTPSSLPRSSSNDNPYNINRSTIHPSSSYKDLGPAILSKSPPTSNPPFFGSFKASSPSAIDIAAKYSSVMEEARVRTGSTPSSTFSPTSLPSSSSLTGVNSPLASTQQENTSDSFEKDCVIIHSGTQENSFGDEESTTDEVVLVNELAEMLNRAVTISEIAELKSGPEPTVAFVLVVKALSILRTANQIAKKTTLQNFNQMIRVEGIEERLQSKYAELIKKGEFLKGSLQPSDVVASPERVLYEYALQLGKEAALDEEMYSNYAKSQVMLQTAVILFEQLLFECSEEADKKTLKSHIQAYKNRLQDVRKKVET